MVIQLAIQLVPIKKVSYSHNSTQLHACMHVYTQYVSCDSVILSGQYPVYYIGPFVLGVTASPFDFGLDCHLSIL